MSIYYEDLSLPLDVLEIEIHITREMEYKGDSVVWNTDLSFMDRCLDTFICLGRWAVVWKTGQYSFYRDDWVSVND